MYYPKSKQVSTSALIKLFKFIEQIYEMADFPPPSFRIFYLYYFAT